MALRSKVKTYIIDHQFACFILLCIVIAIIMTAISLKLYERSGAIRLDMSRPGYEKVRKEVEKESDDQPYDSTGALDSKAVKDFESRLDKYDKELNGLGKFDSSVLTDENLGLTDSSESPSDLPASEPGNVAQ